MVGAILKFPVDGCGTSHYVYAIRTNHLGANQKMNAATWNKKGDVTHTWILQDGTEVEYTYNNIPDVVRADMRRNAIACAKAAEVATGRPQPVEFVPWRDAIVEESGSKASGHAGPVDPIAKARHGEAVAYIGSYAGTFSLILDLKAKLDRDGINYFSMSERQVEVVLNSKAREATWKSEADAKNANPDNARAIAFLESYTGTFDFLLDMKRQTKWGLSERQVAAVLKCADREEAPKAGPLSVDPKFEVVDQRADKDGFYKRGEIIFKVQVAVHGSGNLYAKRLVVEEFGHASWEYAPGVITTLLDSERLSLEDAQAFGRLYGVCGVCGRTLTDEASIAAGIGPVCASNL